MHGVASAPTSAFTLPRRWRIAGLLTALALGAWCYAPALHAFFAQDDFAFLAFVRLLHEPWLLFVHNHFPDYAYFRPLGVLLWWFVAAAAADAAWPQYALNLALHLGCVAALYTLLQRLHRDAPLNAAWAALYAVHPLAVGTALWLSDRFDLLAMLFSLLALNAALAYVERPRTATLLGLLGALLLAFLGKELGIVGAIAAFAAIALAPRAQPEAKRRATALGAIVALTLAWLAYRHAMLSVPVGDGSVRLPALAAFATGSRNWLRAGAVYLFADPRAPRWTIVCVASATVLWIVAALQARRAAPDSRPRLHVAAALLVLALLPGLVQAPVAAKHLAAGIGADGFFFNLIVPSRFFHLTLSGLVCLLAAITAAPRARSASALGLCALGIALAVAALAPLSQRIARDYADGTNRQAAAFASAEAALDRAALPAHACQVYFLHTASLWGFAGYSDAIAKGLATDPERLAHCLVSTEQPAWTYFVRRASVQTDDARPLHPLAIAGTPFPTLTIGNVQALYFTMGEDMRTALPGDAIFLDYRDGAFVDVSAAVRSGELKPDFQITKQN
ncbi:MAG: hypothetical protein QM741_07040 [Rudaea sp.]|uniref:hypothetical protein n=1 Tax=Rudaea sp. TaxID=2136325 RepID=UPI0039E24251